MRYFKVMKTPDKINYFIQAGSCDTTRVSICKNFFGGYHLIISPVNGSIVEYRSADDTAVLRALRAYGALNDPAVSLMFPHWRVEDE